MTGRRPKHPDDEKVCEFARGPSGVPGQTSPSLTGSFLPWWSRSARTERASKLVEPRPPSPCTRAGTGPYRGSTADPGDERVWLRHQDRTGVNQPYGSVSTALTSTAPMPLHPAGIVGMPRFCPGMQRRSGVDVSTMDTDTPQSLDAVLCPTIEPPHVADVRSGATSRFTVAPDRPHCTSVGRHGTKVGRTP